MSRERTSPDGVGAGRVNQKKRTRAAIVEAATRLMAEGTTPTVAQAAELAMVSRTTAYRYFPTQESLLLEIAVTAGVQEIEERVHQPLDGQSPVDRTLEVMRAFNQNVIDEETQYRSSTRLYQDLWLTAYAAGDEAPVVREGRRRRWLDTTLGELDGVTPADRDRLIAALSMVMGPEGMIALRDIVRLSGEDALVVAEWAARALIAATLDPR